MAAELRKKSISELNVELTNLMQEGFKTKMRVAAGSGKSPHHLLKKNRKDVARVKTIIHEKECGERA